MAVRLRSVLAIAASLIIAATAAPVADDAASRFTFVDLPTPAALPCDLCTGPDGAEWVQYFLSEKLARIDPVTKQVKEYDIPWTSPPLGNLSSLPSAGGLALGACVIRPGKDGNIYAANGLRNQLVKLDLKTEKVTVYTPPGLLSALGNLQPFNDLWPGETGMFFSQTTANLISLFDYKTHEIKSWSVPTPLSSPLGMRTSYDGALYFAELVGQKIGRLDPKTGEIKEYPLPIPSLLGPAVLRVQTEGKYVWFTGALSNSIGRMNIYTGEFKAYPNTAPLSAASVPSEITIDKSGTIWFCTWTQNIIHSLNPNTGAMEHITVPGTVVAAPVSVPFGFGVGIDYYPPKNQIYFTQTALNRVGIYQL